MDTELFKGELVRLTAEEPQVLAETFARWNRDSEYHRLLDNDPASQWSARQMKAWIEKDTQGDNPTAGYFFQIRALAEDKLIGFIGLGGIRWPHGDAWVGIGIGERDYWGKGYGTDAMRIVLRYAFTELNLHRVTLDVFEYNPRGVRSYEKAGFKLEGRERGLVQREGRHYDAFCMGILRDEWLAAQAE
jgi:RimJ/RimL family protein N-acetyltransferase